MAIEIIDKLKQKNNGSFKLVDAEDVDYDGSGKSLKDKIDEFNVEVSKIYKDYSGADIFDLTNLDKIIEEFISRYLFDYRKLNKINWEFKGSEGLSVYLVY